MPTDTTPPHGTLYLEGFVPMPGDAGLTDISVYRGSPTLVDIDGDGDMDLVMGYQYNQVAVYLNEGTATAPSFGEPTVNPYGLELPNTPNYATVTFADIDDDGDLDAFLASSTVYLLVNTGGPTDPAFAAPSEVPNVFGGAQNTSPTLVDIDGDGDLDMFIGINLGGSGYMLPFINYGDSTNPSFEFSGAFEMKGPLVDGYTFFYPQAVFYDFDSDGDYDAFVADGAHISLFENTGTATNPVFTTPYVVEPLGLSNPDALTSHGELATRLAFGDLNGDGKPDMVVEGRFGVSAVFANLSGYVAPVGSTSADGTYGLGSAIHLTVSFDEAVYVDTLGGVPVIRLLLDDDNIGWAYYDGGSGTSTLSFTYAPGLGENAAHLDISDSGALILAGGSIRDAAGNDADLTLGQPGGEGSLAANASIAVDTTPPVAAVTTATLHGNDDATVSSTETGTAYLVTSLLYPVSAVSQITNLPDNEWNAVTISAPNTSTSISVAGLEDGVYMVYTKDSPGNLSEAATGYIIVDNTPPVASLQTDTLRPSGSATFQSSESGHAYLVNTNVDVTGIDSITNAADSQWNAGNVDTADTDSTMSLAGLADGTYKLYTFDDVGNMSEASTGTVTIDTVAPRGTIGGVGVLSAPIASPFGLSRVGYYPAPTFVDIDHDGDLDAFLGYNALPLVFAENTGDATHPDFATPVATPFSLPDIPTTVTNPAFADIDGDGDKDAFLENGANQIVFVQNVGSASSPDFTGPVVANPFGIVDAGDGRSAPTFADIDGDGDLDAFVANYYGQSISYFENTGTATNPSFVGRGTNPFGLTTNARVSSVAFGDLDGDGDLDAFVGMGNSVWYEENVGTRADPSFAARVWIPVNFGGSPNAALADIDGDGDLDLVVGNWLGDIALLRNDSVAPITTSAADGTYGVGSTIELSLTFNEAVYVDGGIPTITLETGDTDHAAVYTGGSGTNTLTFTYTVMAGDHSSDLDITGSSAFSLNGATIRDAAGNDAIITVADAGAQGSLAAGADIVIDTRPTATLASQALNHDAAATVQSSETGTAYLVNSHVVVTDVASITSAADNQWNSVDITDADSDTALSLTGLVDGTYKLYTVDEFGALSNASAGTVTVDDVAPHGTVQSPASFPTAQYNPYTLGSDVGGRALVDIDGDGDLDEFSGSNSYFGIRFQENTGDATHPSFGSVQVDPFGLFVRGLYTPAPVFADIDHDGDLDAFVGGFSGDIGFFENAGDALHPVFGPMQVDPFGLPSTAAYLAPALGDIDGDGDLDMLVGQPDGQIALYENTGSASSASFTDAGTIDVGVGSTGYRWAYPTLVDIDGDGDLDLYIGAYYGSVFFSRNTGTATDPVFAPATRLGYSDLDFYGTVRPTFGDIDGDGDLDMMLSDRQGNTVVRLNGSQYSVGVTTSNANGVYSVGDQIHITITFNENVYVDADGGTPTITMETGDTDRDALYVGGSGTKTLHFTYTVQAGDSSSDLDIASAILWLNGSTIQDAAGNDAVIDLATPGSTGSLSANADIVIDGLPDPVATLEQGTYANTTSATVQSSRVGTAYLVNSHVTVSDVASITGADDDQWNSVAVTDANSDTPLDLAGLADGTYVLYTVSDTGRISAASSDSLTITSSLTFTGTAGNDSIVGTFGGDDTIRGLGGNDVLNGLSGNDFLDGGAGNDSLYGGAGNDVLKGNTGADLMSGGDGNDTYYFDNAGDTIVESATGGSDTVIVSIAAFNATAAGADHVENIKTTYAGGASLDGNALNNVITGSTGSDTLYGEGGNDVLNGGAGVDTMIGGDGSDRYYVDDTNDVATETNDSLSGGVDTVYSSASSFTLGANIENGVVNTSAGAALTGNGLNNKLTGGTGDDSLTGGGGNDIIDGGWGADTMAGGDGNDRYYVNDTNDVVTETAGGGVDTVYSIASSYTLGDNVENGVVAAGIDGALTGNALDNKLTGNEVGNIALDGGAGNDTLDSANVNNFSDSLIGGDGNDTFYVHSFFDNVIEYVGGGIDTVIDTGGHFALSIRGANVENIKTTFAGSAFLTGNELNNAITGFTGSDVLSGFEGNDTINGGAGDDTMTGGTGNDTYYVDSFHDVVTENTGEGTDTVISSVSSYALAANVENLRTNYAGNAMLRGNDLNNVITGGSGNDTITGAGGNDKMTGGAGADTFYFESTSGRDTITDFSSADHDVIQVHQGSNGLNFSSGADVLARATNAADGAVIDLGNGNTVKLVGVFVADLHASDFSIAVDGSGSDIL